MTPLKYFTSFLENHFVPSPLNFQPVYINGLNILVIQEKFNKKQISHWVRWTSLINQFWVFLITWVEFDANNLFLSFRLQIGLIQFPFRKQNMTGNFIRSQGSKINGKGSLLLFFPNDGDYSMITFFIKE